jgi:hypothetical protein
MFQKGQGVSRFPPSPLGNRQVRVWPILLEKSGRRILAQCSVGPMRGARIDDSSFADFLNHFCVQERTKYSLRTFSTQSAQSGHASALVLHAL